MKRLFKKLVFISLLGWVMALPILLHSCKEESNNKQGNSNVQPTTVRTRSDNSKTSKDKNAPTVVDLFEGFEINLEFPNCQYPDMEVRWNTKKSPYNQNYLHEGFFFPAKITYLGIDAVEVTMTADIPRMQEFLDANNYVPESDTKVLTFKREGLSYHLLTKEMLTDEIKEKLIAGMQAKVQEKYGISDDLTLNSMYTILPEKDINYATIMEGGYILSNHRSQTHLYDFVCIFTNANGEFFPVKSNPIFSPDGTLDEKLTTYDCLSNSFIEIRSIEEAEEFISAHISSASMKQGVKLGMVLVTEKLS